MQMPFDWIPATPYKAGGTWKDWVSLLFSPRVAAGQLALTGAPEQPCRPMLSPGLAVQINQARISSVSSWELQAQRTVSALIKPQLLS